MLRLANIPEPTGGCLTCPRPPSGIVPGGRELRGGARVWAARLRLLEEADCLARRLWRLPMRIMTVFAGLGASKARPGRGMPRQTPATACQREHGPRPCPPPRLSSSICALVRAGSALWGEEHVRPIGEALSTCIGSGPSDAHSRSSTRTFCKHTWTVQVASRHVVLRLIRATGLGWVGLDRSTWLHGGSFVSPHLAY